MKICERIYAIGAAFPTVSHYLWLIKEYGKKMNRKPLLPFIFDYEKVMKSSRLNLCNGKIFIAEQLFRTESNVAALSFYSVQENVLRMEYVFKFFIIISRRVSVICAIFELMSFNRDNFEICFKPSQLYQILKKQRNGMAFNPPGNHQKLSSDF